MTISFDHARAAQSATDIRRFEETLLDLFRQGKLTGTTHTSLGQEANAVGVAMALRPDDIVVSNHRCHGHFLAHGGDMAALFAEIMGRAGGVCGGWGGSQHLCRPGRFFSNGIQGGILPLSLGLALALRRQGEGRAVATFIGDGTLGQGAVYESLNMAACWGAPLLVVVEDNGIAQTTLTGGTTAGTVGGRAAAFGLEYRSLSYPTAEAVHGAVSELLTGVRGGRPAVLHIRSARLGPHSKGDDTRPVEEVERLRQLDPLAAMIAGLPDDEADHIRTRAERRVAEALAVAEASPTASPPPPEVVSPADHRRPLADDPASNAILASLSGRTLLEQVNTALHSAFDAHPSVLLVGEDLLDPYGGAFKASAGLSSRHPDRVVATPISEESFVGLAGGLAMEGFTPIVEVMFGDFLAVSANQIINHLSLYRGMYGGQVRVPVVIRTPMGGGRGYGPTHSQSLEKLFAGLTDLRILAPSHLHPYGPLLEAALAAPGPTLMVENKISYPRRVEVDPSGLVGDLFAHYAGEGEDMILSLSPTAFEDEAVTLVCYGGMVPVAMEAVRLLLVQHEVAARLVAPARIHPLDGAAVASAMVEGAAVVAVEEANPAFGFGAELAAQLAEAGVSPSAFRRVGARRAAIGAAHSLEQAVLPDAAAIVAAALDVLGGR